MPWAELGLKQNEFDEVVKVLGRRPTAAELAMYSVMWSEHCSYKSSKVHLRQFGDKVTEDMKKHMLVGIGENAGVTDLGDGWAVTFKIESHNSPDHGGALPGRRDRHRRHRARHHFHGRAPGGRDGPAALRRDRPPGHRPRGARRGCRHRRLRQLAGPAEHRRRGGLRLRLPGQPAGERAGRGHHAPRGHPAGQRLRQGQQGGAVRRPHRRRRHRRRLHPVLGVLRRHQALQAPRRAGRRPVRGEGADRVLPGTVQGLPGRGHPGPGRGRHFLRHLGTCLQRRRRHGR